MRFPVLIAALLSTVPALTSPAFANEEKGMAVPQFDPSSFPSQLFWLAISFAVLYILMAKIALPRIGFVVEQRAGKIEQDVEAAKAAATEASTLQSGYESALNTARGSAREQLSAATAAAIATQTETLAKQNAELVARLQTAETAIQAARQAAMASITPTAVAAATATLHKLTGINVDGAHLASAIETALKKA